MSTYVDLVVENLVVKDLVLKKELLLKGQGEKFLLLHVDIVHVHLVDGVEGLIERVELVGGGNLVVSVDHSGNNRVHHLLLKHDFFGEDGLHGLISVHHLLEEHLLEKILVELITEGGVIVSLVGVEVNWVVELITVDGLLEGLESIDWVGEVILLEVFLDEFFWNFVQMRVDFDQDILDEEIILELEFLVVVGWDKMLVLQEVTFEASDVWKGISVLNFTINGRNGDVGLEEVDNWVDVLVEKDRLDEVNLRSRK